MKLHSSDSPNLKSALIIEPNLTSVAQPTFEMGRVAAKLLLEQIRNYSETIGPHQSISLQENSISGNRHSARTKCIFNKEPKFAPDRNKSAEM